MNLTHDIDKMHGSEMKRRAHEKLFLRVKSRFYTIFFLIAIFLIILVVNFKTLDNTLSMIPIYAFGAAIVLMIIFLIVDYVRLRRMR
jgi:hypothetical protein